MAGIRRFEDLEAWQRARDLTRLVYRHSAHGEFAHDLPLRNQIRRAAISIVSNIAEGFERGGNKEFRQFLALAKASAGEVRAQLYVALDARFLTPTEFDKLCALANETSRLIAGLMGYLADSDMRGFKFRRDPPE